MTAVTKHADCTSLAHMDFHCLPETDAVARKTLLAYYGTGT